MRSPVLNRWRQWLIPRGHLPDSDLVHANAAEEGQDHVWERVNWVQSIELCLREVVRWFLQVRLQRRWVVETEVRSHEEEAPKDEHQPPQVRVSDQLLLWNVISLRRSGVITLTELVVDAQELVILLLLDCSVILNKENWSSGKKLLTYSSVMLLFSILNYN